MSETISFFGNFGTQNFGNEYTLQAILHHVRRYLPEARLNCICTDPRDTSARYGLPAFPISRRYGKQPQPRRLPPVLRWLRRLFIGVPLELLGWLEAFRTLHGTTMLVMTGTGMLGDFGIGPFDLHYEILKWSLLAKLRGGRVLFVSVGAGPIENKLSRRIVKWAASLADYRSYRDDFSKAYMASIGFDTGGDSVYPDLAFSLAPPARAPRQSGARVVGLGLMDYYGKGSVEDYSEEIYQAYLDKIARFAGWLLDRHYIVRLLVGDHSYDTRIKKDLAARLKDRGGKLLDEPVSSVQELLGQLAETDLVIATRFHNLLLALMLNKPVLALCYHEKIASLMKAVGMADYCLGIHLLDPDRLAGEFLRLERNAADLKPMIERKTKEYGAALDQQYATIFGPRGGTR